MPDRRLLWQRLDMPGMDQCTVRWDATGGAASGISVGQRDGFSFGARWEVRWDADWVTRQVLVTVDDRLVNLEQRGPGAWYDQDGAREDLVGLWDVDIACTPFTNTLAIRRLKMAVGASTALSVVYVSVPTLTVVAVPQRYTRLAPQRYRYEGLFRDFQGELTLDADKLVEQYEGTFKRIHAA